MLNKKYRIYAQSLIEIANQTYEEYEDFNEELMEIMVHNDAYVLLLWEELEEIYLK